MTNFLYNYIALCASSGFIRCQKAWQGKWAVGFGQTRRWLAKFKLSEHWLKTKTTFLNPTSSPPPSSNSRFSPASHRSIPPNCCLRSTRTSLTNSYLFFERSLPREHEICTLRRRVSSATTMDKFSPRDASSSFGTSVTRKACHVTRFITNRYTPWNCIGTSNLSRSKVCTGPTTSCSSIRLTILT